MLSKTDEDYRRELTPLQYQVTRQGGTERPFKNEYWDCKDQGIYLCRCCDAPLFSSDDKFDSGTGWPSFTRSISREAVDANVDTSHGMVRTEVVCAGCRAHLGHVFPDGPPPTERRFCMNSASLKLQPKGQAGEGEAA